MHWVSKMHQFDTGLLSLIMMVSPTPFWQWCLMHFNWYFKNCFKWFWTTFCLLFCTLFTNATLRCSSIKNALLFYQTCQRALHKRKDIWKQSETEPSTVSLGQFCLGSFLALSYHVSVRCLAGPECWRLYLRGLWPVCPAEGRQSYKASLLQRNQAQPACCPGNQPPVSATRKKK